MSTNNCIILAISFLILAYICFYSKKESFDDDDTVVVRNELTTQQKEVKQYVHGVEDEYSLDWDPKSYRNSQGWWKDVLDCQYYPHSKNMYDELYCRPKDNPYIWPY